ncbi:integrase, catalytic region, zinc finger, CCHC-type containing protein [Tanacetum coccineum]
MSCLLLFFHHFHISPLFININNQDLEWYEALEDSELKDEALCNKAIMERLISDDESSNDCWKRWKSHEIYYNNYDEGNIKLKLMKKTMSYVQGNDPIDAINHMMSFLLAVVTSRYPTTNNQLRNSSNPRQQATINDGKITLQPVRRRQISFSLGTSRTYTTGASESNSGKQRTIICYNYKGEGHMSKQCTKPKRKRDDSWFKDKVLLVQDQANGQILHEEELSFLADPGIAEG